MGTMRATLGSGSNKIDMAELVERAVGGDSAAREALAVSVLPRVRKLVYFAYGNRSDFDDVVQIAMITIFKDLSNLRNVACFTGWLDRLVYNVVRVHGKKRTRFNALFTTVDEPQDMRSWSVTPEDEKIGHQLAEHLQKHLDTINPKKRAAAVMSIFFGYVNTEVAEMMDCSVETAKKRILFGRKELLEKVHRDSQCRGLMQLPLSESSAAPHH